VRTTIIYLTAVASTYALGFDSGAATVTIEASRDATIFENNVNNGSGGGNGLFSGTNGAQNSPRRALIGFNVAGSVPAGALIQDVQLTLFLGQFPNVGAQPTSTIGLHRVAADWSEGTTQEQIPPNDTFGGLGQGAPAVDGDVTWNARTFSATTPTPWTAAGGDFDPTVSASTVVTRTLLSGYVWGSTETLVGDVQGWIENPASNFGWMLVNAQETTPATFRAFYSHETATAALRPQLSLTYVLTGDFDANDVVDGADLANWKANLGASGVATHAQGDADGDRDVDGADFLVWQRQLGSGAPASPSTASVPEPATLMLACVAAIGMAASARRTRANGTAGAPTI
jgi:hypothetical protein